jgi:hypothetical protein
MSRYDVIVAGDILEPVVDPDTLFRSLRDHWFRAARRLGSRG